MNKDICSEIWKYERNINFRLVCKSFDDGFLQAMKMGYVAATGTENVTDNELHYFKMAKIICFFNCSKITNDGLRCLTDAYYLDIKCCENITYDVVKLLPNVKYFVFGGGHFVDKILAKCMYNITHYSDTYRFYSLYDERLAEIGKMTKKHESGQHITIFNEPLRIEKKIAAKKQQNSLFQRFLSFFKNF